jgi:hypothetical protein
MPEFEFIIFGGLYLSVKRDNINMINIGRSHYEKVGNAVLIIADSRDPDMRKIDTQKYFEIDFDDKENPVSEKTYEHLARSIKGES